MLKKVFPFYDGNLMKMIIRIPLPCQPSKTRWLVGEPGRERCLPACNSPTWVSSLLRTSLLTHSPLPYQQPLPPHPAMQPGVWEGRVRAATESGTRVADLLPPHTATPALHLRPPERTVIKMVVRQQRKVPPDLFHR